jgi:hypothetical protein
MAYDVRLTLNQTNTYSSEGYVATREDVVVEKEGRSWKNVTYTKEHSTCWKVLMGTAAFFATLGTFVIGAFLIDGIKKLWERACSGKEVVIVAIEQKNLNDEQQKVATKGQEVLEVETPKSLETKIHTEEDDLNLEEKVFDEKDLRQHFSKDNPMLNIPGFIDYCLKLKNENDPEKAEELKRIFISQILKENDPEMKYMQEFVTYTGTPEEIARFKEQNPIFSIDDIKKGLSDGNPLKDNEAFLQLAVLLKNETDEHKKLDLKSQIANFMNKFVQAQGQANFEIYGFEVMKLLGEPHEIAAVQAELQKRGFNV